MQLNDPALLRTQCLINGRWVSAAHGATFAVNNPANRQLLCEVPKLGAAETTQAIEAAQAALPAWRARPAKSRATALRRWHDLILAAADDLAAIMTAEQGKSLAEARGEVLYAASFIEWFAEEAKRIEGEVLASPAADKRLMVIKEPIGVCALITPWNFPAAMITRKCAPALAAGCTVVIKPAEQTPLTALALGELAQRAGIPAGVINILTGEPAVIGAELTANPIVRKLSFTGSTEVGRLLMAQCAPTIKKLSLELGGNAPFIVFDDADIDAAVEGAMMAKYRNSGQTCVCANRLYVHDAVHDAFVAKYAARVASLKVGAGDAPGTQVGPLIDAAAVDKVEAHIKDALDHGAKLLTGGKRHALGGYFFEPTVLTDVTQVMRCAREETFGPLAPILRFTDEAAVIQSANNTEYGLAAYFYSRDMARCFRVSEALEYGMVGVNAGILSNEVAPFGGIKQSGIGREGSRHGIEEYLEMKYVCFGGV
ncbi:MAG: hypothetical protein RIR70_504 [Pseudomonadota bacterium]